ncbi:hypothetical protein ABI125_03420 [Tamlana crocina]
MAIIHDAENLTVKNASIKTPDSIIEVLGGKNIAFKKLALDLGGATLEKQMAFCLRIVLWNRHPLKKNIKITYSFV